jgi:hypothetical protein
MLLRTGQDVGSRVILRSFPTGSYVHDIVRQPVQRLFFWRENRKSDTKLKRGRR